MANVLVVYYSRTGKTRKVGEAIVEASGWASDPIVDTRDRAGPLGYLRSGFEARAGRRTRLEPPHEDPGRHDLVVIGTPIWSSSLSSPVRTYLTDHAGALRQVAFFVTFGGSGDRRVLAQMEQLAGVPPLATLVLTDRQVARGAHLAPVQRFVDDLRRQLGAGVPAPAREITAEIRTSSRR